MQHISWGFGEDTNTVNLTEKAKQLKTDIPVIVLSLKSSNTPLVAKILAGMTAAYALSPIDLIPDFIPVLGYLDDLIILPALIAATIKLIPVETLTQCKKQAESMLQDGKLKKWYYAIPVVVIWLLLIGLIAKLVIY